MHISTIKENIKKINCIVDSIFEELNIQPTKTSIAKYDKYFDPSLMDLENEYPAILNKIML